MIIREVNIADAKQIANLHILSWKNTYKGILSDEYLNGPIELERQIYWQQKLMNPSNKQQIFVAENLDKQIIGFICIALQNDDYFHTLIDNLHVIPTAKGQGIGTSLLEEACKWLELKEQNKSIYLWVLEKNTTSLKYYQNLNIKIVETCPQIQADGQSINSIRCVWESPKHLRDSIKAKKYI